MSKFRWLQGLVVALIGWVGLFVPHLDAVAAASVTGTQLVNTVRTGRTSFDFSYRVVVQNGTPALTAAAVTVTSSSPATVIVKGSAILGDLAANATVTSTDVITIRQDRTVPFNAPALTWLVTGTPVISNVIVPNVVNLTQAAATTAITGAGLAVGTTTQASSATVPAGSVISQNPAAGASVAPGSAVNLVISSGPATVIVPNVVNLTQAAATTAITGPGLAVGTTTQASSATVPAGSVISQTPAAGTLVTPSSAVNLVISSGPATVTVPNVVNLTQTAATTAITGAGLTVGGITLTNSNTVPAGSVISQNPAAGASVAPGSAVSLTVSVGASTGGPVPASVQLQIGTLVVAAGGSSPITTVVRDASNVPIIPAPPVTYAIVSPAGNAGAVPTTGSPVGVLSLLTSADTRGAYTLRVTVDGTAIAASVNFAVIEATPPAGSTLSNGERLVAFGTAESTVADKLSAISAAFNNNQPSLIPALNTALQAAAAGVPVTGRTGMERTTPVAPDEGFLPSTSLLSSRGFPQTADDVVFGNLLDQIDAKVAQITTFYANLDPASATNDDNTLNQLNTELTGLLTQLLAVNVSPFGVVSNAPRLNILLALTIPGHLQAVSTRINTVLVANQLASVQTSPTEFYAGLANPSPDSELLEPNALYRNPQPAFFGLVGLLAGSSLQMGLVNQIYGKYLQEVTRMMILLGVNSLLQTYTNSSAMEGIISGASLSFHAPNLPGSVIEGTGQNPTPKRNDVYFIGPEAISAVQGVLGSFDPRGVKSFKDLYKFFDGIVGALQTGGQAYVNAHKLPSEFVTGGCILDGGSNPSCTELFYDVGFPDVNDTRFPSPVIVLYHNVDTGTWAQGIFNFIP